MCFRYPIIVVCLLMLIGQLTYGQGLLPISGVVYDTSHLYVVPNVDVYSTRNAHTVTDSLGRYRIMVMPSDSIYFFYNGKPSIKYPVKEIYDDNSFDIALQVPVSSKFKVLKEVTVLSRSYHQDSLENREQYANIFGNRGAHLSTTDGGAMGVPGLDIGSIVSLFQFRKNKRNQIFKERLLDQEQDGYIDYRFNPRLVTRMTGLKGVYLEEYMQKYRPSFYFVQNSTQVEFYEYILNTSYIFKEDHGMKPDFRMDN